MQAPSPDQCLLTKYLCDIIRDFNRLQLPFTDEKGRDSLPFDSAVTGDAGAGKSTLLRYIARRIALARLFRIAPERAAAPRLRFRAAIFGPGACCLVWKRWGWSGRPFSVSERRMPRSHGRLG